ncbi:glycosyl hydrolase family 18 protein [Vibrio pectenicida]|uniref:glycosyl hydrolase family 18 protein n=1 Tax=Vibrio pectenicida TaxID=62763 RepID=UPI003B9C8B73
MFKKEFSKQALLLASIPMFLSSAVFASDDPFIMGYYTNYAGYSNANGLPGAMDDWGNNAEGRIIPQPSYPLPGITSGFPVMDASGSADGTHVPDGEAQPTDNDDLTDKLEGLSALTYAFMMPGDNGALIFNDAWADLSTNDYQPGGIADPAGDAAALGMVPSSSASAHYGQFDAFVNLNKSDGDLEHYVAVGGWTYRDEIMDKLVSSSENQANFLASLQILKDAGVEGIDLDIEFTNVPDDWANSLLLEKLGTTDLVQQIKQIGLKVAVTVQATPDMLEDEVFTGYLNHMFENDLDHFSLMTYDMHGAFDASSPGGGYTGFNSSLFPAPDGLTSPFTDDFSVDTAINALKQGGLNDEYFAKVNIGLPSYSRANLTGIDSSNGGLFNSIPANSKVLPGDMDEVACITNYDAQSTSCGGMFNYNYLLQDVVNKSGSSGFVSQDWTYNDNGTTYHIGTTAYSQNSWQPVTSTLSFTDGGMDALATLVDGDHGYTYPGDSNIFMSYISGQVAQSYGQYAKEQGLGGAIIWTINGDAAYDDTDNSLIYNFADGYVNSDGGTGGENQSPEVSLTAPASVNEGEEAVINAEVSDDGDLSELTYVWQTTEGSINGEGESVTFIAPEVDENTEVTITLTVTDAEGATDSESINITVNDQDGGGEPGDYPAWDPEETYSDICTYVTYNGKNYVNGWYTDVEPDEAAAQTNMDLGYMQVSTPWILDEDEKNKTTYGCE